MSNIPVHMRGNSPRAPKQVIKDALKLLRKHGVPSYGEGIDSLLLGDLSLGVRWKCRFLRRWEWVVIEVPVSGSRTLSNYDHVLVEYDDFTRIYIPGEWETELISRAGAL